MTNTIEQQRELEAALIQTFDAELVAFFKTSGAGNPVAEVGTAVAPEEQPELW